MEDARRVHSTLGHQEMEVDILAKTWIKPSDRAREEGQWDTDNLDHLNLLTGIFPLFLIAREAS